MNIYHRKATNITLYFQSLCNQNFPSKELVNHYKLFLDHETHLYTNILHKQVFQFNNTVFHSHSSYFSSNFPHNSLHLCNKKCLLHLSVPPEIACRYSEKVQRLLGYGTLNGTFIGQTDGRDPIRLCQEAARQQQAQGSWIDWTGKCRTGGV